MSHPSASTGALLDWWSSACCLLAPRTCLILLDWAAPLPDMVHMPCAPRERAATVRRPTPHASPFLGCLVLLAGWTRGMLCSPTSQPDYLAICLIFTVALFSGL
eukprot:scaffold584434_cov20-Prasinocladus_malaysianus.AAC.1